MAQKPADLDQLIEHLGHALQIARETRMKMTEHLVQMALLDLAQFIQQHDAAPARRCRRRRGRLQ